MVNDVSGPPASKADYVLERLRQELSNGQLRAGEELRQQHLAERYGVSATPVREALRRLESEGFIRYTPHKVATVVDLPSLDINDLYMLRAQIESLTARLAVERATDEQIAEIEAAHNRLRDGVSEPSPKEMSELNRAFHMKLVEVGSAYIASNFLAPIWQHLLPTSIHAWADPVTMNAIIDEHELILSALRARDGERIETLMKEHVLDARDKRLAATTDRPESTD